MRIILGIDPGSQFTGFGIVRLDGQRVEHVSHGVIAPPSKLDFNQRVGIIASEVAALMERMSPDVTVIEKVFLGKNPDSAFKLGHVRGVVVAAAMAAESAVVEYATRSVKKGITGNGGATKDQVQMVLFAHLQIRVRAKADASDALALAYYHARMLEVSGHLRGSEARGRKRLKETGL